MHRETRKKKTKHTFVGFAHLFLVSLAGLLGLLHIASLSHLGFFFLRSYLLGFGAFSLLTSQSHGVDGGTSFLCGNDIVVVPSRRARIFRLRINIGIACFQPCDALMAILFSCVTDKGLTFTE
jgi:hypothetical protein